MLKSVMSVKMDSTMTKDHVLHVLQVVNSALTILVYFVIMINIWIIQLDYV
jgi:hypothetical protein